MLILLLLTPSAAFAEGTLVVGVAENLILKDQRSRAERVLGELIALIGKEVNFPMKLILIPSGSRQALANMANEIQQGRLHLVALNGVESGWLREQSGGRVHPLAVSDQTIQVVQYEQLIVRKDSNKQMSQLQGASLVLYREPYPSLTIYLRQLNRKWGPDFLSRRLKSVSSGSRALQAVLAGKADATIVDLYTLQGYQKVFPGQAAKLQVVGRSPSYPLAPVVGVEELVNELRPNLWRDVQTTLTQIHTNPKARAFLDVWRVRKFKLPTPKFEQQVIKAAQQFPLSELAAGNPR